MNDRYSENICANCPDPADAEACLKVAEETGRTFICLGSVEVPAYGVVDEHEAEGDQQDYPELSMADYISKRLNETELEQTGKTLVCGSDVLGTA
jgi:hypothetical protein